MNMNKDVPTSHTSPHEKSETRKKILDSAAALYSQNGASATTMRDIAKACGINAGSIYHHFASKDDITQEILDFGIICVIESLTKALEDLGPDASFMTRFRVAIDSHVRSFKKFENYTVAHLRVFKQVPVFIRQKNIVYRDRYERIWQDLLSEGVAAGVIDPAIDLQAARLLLLGQINWTVEWFIEDRALSTDQLVDLIVRLFFSGCSVSPQDQTLGADALERIKI